NRHSTAWGGPRPSARTGLAPPGHSTVSSRSIPRAPTVARPGSGGPRWRSRPTTSRRPSPASRPWRPSRLPRPTPKDFCSRSDAPTWQAAALLEAGKVYERLAQWVDAAETYERLRTKFPGDPSAEEAKSLLEGVRKRLASQDGAAKTADAGKR